MGFCQPPSLASDVVNPVRESTFGDFSRLKQLFSNGINPQKSETFSYKYSVTFGSNEPHILAIFQDLTSIDFFTKKCYNRQLQN